MLVRWRGRRLGAWRPLGRADLARVAGDVLRGLHLAQQFLGVASDAVVVHFKQLDLALGADHEGAPQRQSFFFDHDAEVAGQRAGRVAHERVLDLPDRVRGVVPGFVREVRVGRDAVDFHAQRLEGVVVVGQVAQFGRADEGEVGRVEEEHAPLALERGFGDVDELAVVISRGLEGLDLGVDEGHSFCSLWGFVSGTERMLGAVQHPVVWLNG
jgi:hypothetical protein